MKTPLYKEALAHSWRLARSHKELWIFGLFAAVLGQMGVVELLSKVTFSSKRFAEFDSFIPGLDIIPTLYALKAAPWNAELGVMFIWLLVILLGFVIFAVFIAVTSQGAIIHAASKSMGRSKQLPSSSKAWHAGVTHFWRLLSLNVFKKVVLWGLAFLVAVSTFNAIASGGFWDITAFIALFILSMVIGLIVSFLVVYAAGYVVVEEYSFWEAVKASWHLFTSHWLVSIEAGFILLFYNVLLVLVVLAGLFVLMLHSLLLIAVTVSTGVLSLFSIGLFIEFVVFMLFVFLVASVFTVFSTSTWTYLFMKMHKHGMMSHLVHRFHGKK